MIGIGLGYEFRLSYTTLDNVLAEYEPFKKARDEVRSKFGYSCESMVSYPCSDQVTNVSIIINAHNYETKLESAIEAVIKITGKPILFCTGGIYDLEVMKRFKRFVRSRTVFENSLRLRKGFW